MEIVGHDDDSTLSAVERATQWLETINLIDRADDPRLRLSDSRPRLVAAADDPFVNPPLNDVSTLASSADDLVSYYSRALHGAFFRHEETLAEFRRILSLGDAIWLVPLPLGGNAFVKGGSIDVPGFHALCVPGGMLFGGRWVYFAFIINWRASATTDSKTVADFARAVSQAMDIVKERLSL